MQRKVLLAVLLTFLPAIALAVGTLKGKVTDKSLGEALVGANVALTGTTLGAATNVNGEYTIVNVPVGVYTVKATFIGYGPVTVSNVRVNNELTTYQDFTLQSEAVALQAIEIVAEKPLVNKSATNAVRIITNDDIAALPVRGINNILSLSPGVVVQDNTVFIRGGRLDEVGYYLDGVSITNPVLGGRAVNIVQDAVEEIQVQAGGYNAEFGGANSGIVQQSLRTGGNDWKAAVQFATDNVTFQPKSEAFSGEERLGTYWYGYNEFTGTLSGPIVDERFKLFGLFNYLYNRDQAPQPYPGVHIGTIVGETGDVINMQYPAGPLLKNSNELYNYTATLTADLRPFTLRLAGTFTNGTSYNPYNTHRNAGSIANILDGGRIEQIKQYNGSGSLKVTHLLSPSTFYEVTFGYFYQGQKNWDPILKDNILAYGDSVANAEAGVIWERTPSDVTSGQLGRYIRPTRKIVMGFPFNAPGDVLAGYQKVKRENYSFTGSLTTQIGTEHSIKIGGDYQHYTLRNYAWTNDQVFSLASLLSQNAALRDGDPNKVTTEQVLINAGANNYGYDVFGNETNGSGVVAPKYPVFASLYAQDKIEFKDLVMNLGLRYDYINTDNYAFIDPEHPELTIDPTSGVIDPAGLVKVPSYSGVSPRIGLSFPVTDRTVFHTQFGQFVQQSRLRDIFQGLYLTAANVRGGFFIGTPVGFNVRPERTTQYEIGFTQQVSDFASFDITGYYKDIKDQVIYSQQNTGQGSPLGAYYIFTNGDFATTKGLEMSFAMRRIKRVQVNASFTLQDARGTGSYSNSNRGIVGAPLDNVTLFVPVYISPLEYNNAFRGNINVDYHWGRDDGGPILSELGASALLTFNSGHPYTRGIGGADLEGEARSRQPVEPLNASTTPWAFQIDLRVDKTFRLTDRLALNASVFVINLLDTRNVQNVFLRTGTPTDDGYLSDPALGQPLVNTYGPQYTSLYRAINIDYYERYQNAGNLSTVPYFYGPPRQIRLALRLEY
jgi:hypothetical protein